MDDGDLEDGEIRENRDIDDGRERRNEDRQKSQKRRHPSTQNNSTSKKAKLNLSDREPRHNSNRREDVHRNAKSHFADTPSTSRNASQTDRSRAKHDSFNSRDRRELRHNSNRREDLHGNSKSHLPDTSSTSRNDSDPASQTDRSRTKHNSFVPDRGSESSQRISRARKASKTEHRSGFLGTISYLSRPSHTNDDVAGTLANRNEEMDDFLKAPGDCEQLPRLLSVLKRAVESTFSPESKLRIMYTLKQRNFFERHDIIEKLKKINLETFSEENTGFMCDILRVILMMIVDVNLSAMDTMIPISLIRTQAEKNPLLLKDLDIIEDLHKSKADKGAKEMEIKNNLALSLPILPSIECIRAGEEVVIPQHDITKPFLSEEVYLSYMFGVFREDFIRPLVVGIKDYISHRDRGESKRFRSTDVRVYEGVNLLTKISQMENGMVWRIQFKSNFSQRSYIPSVLQYGSLLCLSCDRFDSIMYATVVNRNINDLRKGIVDIKFVDELNTVNPGGNFTMLESRAFYGAYSHTLAFMKKLAREVREGASLPMGRYLTGRSTKAEKPGYIRPSTLFDFSSLQRYGENADDGFNGKTINISDTWPSSAQLGLDESQFDALKHVMSNEISMVQGPPGTGKTLMGVRIAEFLLSNKQAWRYGGEDDEMVPVDEIDILDNVWRRRNIDTRQSRPLLLVSYTNHALDQFLQLLLKTPTMRNCLPHDVVRIGSRSEMNELDKFTLKQQRKSLPNNNLSFRFRESRRSVKYKDDQLQRCLNIISDHKNYLLHEETFLLSDAMEQRHYNQLSCVNREVRLPGNSSVMWIWLELSEDIIPKQRKFPNRVDYSTTTDDILREDRGRILDNNDYEEPCETSAACIPRSVDEDILISDGYFRVADKDHARLIVKGIQEQIQSGDRMSRQEADLISDVWRLCLQDRWRLYRCWANTSVEMRGNPQIHEDIFETESRIYREQRNRVDSHIMQQASLVAMTTTAAARYAEVLKEVAPPIVIIEEAAQVSEQHVLGTLSVGCKQLIMIGDHKQLKPSFHDYSLVKKYHTDVSLFERLVRNNVSYVPLQNQHRMRPEISALLVPHIYNILNNDKSVYGYPDVQGVAKNVFFITHSHSEDTDDDSLSHSNRFEAKFLNKLYRHLRLQNYKPSDITVLAPYKDQVQVLRKLIRETEHTEFGSYGDVRITPVDNYQGEENKIILLSLVRSNKDGRIGHLRAANRVCVSLSRAREGFYIIGDMECIRGASTLWDKIVSKAEKEDIIGKHLELKCQRHPENKMFVGSAEDFKRYKDGGCNLPCDTRLECGHSCSRQCHSNDPDHVQRCTKLKKYSCPKGHPQERQCFKEEDKCAEMVDVLLPCGHGTTAECSRDTSDIKCKAQCEKILPCGHVCQKRCGQPCNKGECNELVKVTGKCGHSFQTACSSKNSASCRVKCSSILDCGHTCRGTCGDCRAGRLHMNCQKRCERTLICGHICQADCTEACPPCSQKCEIRCSHSKCDDQCSKVCTPCIQLCSWQCRRDCSNRYQCTRLCSETCDRDRCSLPCLRRMRCGHRCIALKCELCFCRECHKDPSEFDIFYGTEDEEDAVFYKLPDCGHIFEVSALDQQMEQPLPEDEIKLKDCPRCRTPILTAARYGNIIRKCTQDIESVKEKMLSNKQDMNDERRNLKMQLSVIEDEQRREEFERKLKRTRNTSEIDYLRMQIGFYSNVKAAMKNVQEIRSQKYIPDEVGGELEEDLASLLPWCLRMMFRLSQQELSEFKAELTRLRLLYRTLLIQDTLSGEEASSDKSWVKDTAGELGSGKKISLEVLQGFEVKVNELEEKYPKNGLHITEEERIMIIEAMGFKQKGHWFKCKNGHVYAIGECGGAMTESRCPECQETVGGGSHRLRDDNSFAPEMDGAQFPAWSEQANLQNYILE